MVYNFDMSLFLLSLQVVEKVKQADHEFRDYQFSLMVPVSTIIRQVSACQSSNAHILKTDGILVC